MAPALANIRQHSPKFAKVRQYSPTFVNDDAPSSHKSSRGEATSILTPGVAEFAALKAEIAQLDAEVSSQPSIEQPAQGG